MLQTRSNQRVTGMLSETLTEVSNRRFIPEEPTLIFLYSTLFCSEDSISIFTQGVGHPWK